MPFNHLRKSFSAAKRDEVLPRPFPHEVAGYQTLRIDDSLADDNIIFYTDLVTMDDGVQYVVTTNKIESDAERERDPALKQFAGSDIMVIEPTALTTQDGGFYRDWHIELAEKFHRPVMIMGAQRNHDRYLPFDRQMNDLLAVQAFMAAWYDYDQEYATAEGKSRGGMGSILLQLFAERYGKKIIHADSMEPCIPRRRDALRLGTKGLQLAFNEGLAATQLELTMDEILNMSDTIDLSVDQQLKETVALVNSNIARKVERSDNKDHVVDLTIQSGSVMAYQSVWEKSFAKYPNARFHIIPGGGHASLIGKPFRQLWRTREEARSNVLHADPANRTLAPKAFRQLLDDEATRNNRAAA